MLDELSKLEFSGNYIFNNLGIDAYGVVFKSRDYIDVCYIVFYNPKKNRLWLFNENTGANMEIEGIIKVATINNMKKAYYEKYNRDLVKTWSEFIDIHNYIYA